MNDLERLAIVVGVITVAFILGIFCLILAWCDERQRMRALEEMKRDLSTIDML